MRTTARARSKASLCVLCTQLSQLRAHCHRSALQPVGHSCRPNRSTANGAPEGITSSPERIRSSSVLSAGPSAHCETAARPGVSNSHLQKRKHQTSPQLCRTRHRWKLLTEPQRCKGREGPTRSPRGRSSLQEVRQRREHRRCLQRRPHRPPRSWATLRNRRRRRFIATAMRGKAETGTRPQPLLSAARTAPGQTSPAAPPRTAPGTPRIAATRRVPAGLPSRALRPERSAGKRRSQRSAPQLRARSARTRRTSRLAARESARRNPAAAPGPGGGPARTARSGTARGRSAAAAAGAGQAAGGSAAGVRRLRSAPPNGAARPHAAAALEPPHAPDAPDARSPPAAPRTAAPGAG